MTINGMQKLTLLDYPGNVACLIFTQGCNFRCPFCHNSGLLDMNNNCEKIDEKEVFKYLEKRKGLLDGVCISGGEPLLQKDIEYFIRKVKDLGYKVKLDTNGSSPKKLKQLIEEGLIDYVAMDIKQTLAKYSMVSGVNINTDKIMQSIKILEDSNVLHEFRTTVIKEYHTIFDILEISDMFKKETPYYIQNFRLSSNVMNKNLHGFTEDELIYMEDVLNKKRKIKVR